MPAERTPNAMRRIVAARAQGYCEYCRCPEAFATEGFTVEHTKPRSIGGETTLDNLAWSCVGCNSYKQARTQAIDPETGERVLLYNPRLQAWNEHFDWSNDGIEVVGKTPCGRSTVEALRLNRVGVMNLRRLLAGAGLHPPNLELLGNGE